MLIRRFIYTLFILTISLVSNGQVLLKKNISLLAHEKSFLDLVTRDTVNDMSIDLELPEFNFGLDKKGFNGITFIKKRRKIIILPIGTGRVYELTKEANNDYNLTRTDSTIYAGVNFHSFTFYLNDSLFQLGGTGFWNIRGIITYFSEKTKQWELVMSDKIMPTYKPKESIFLLKPNDQANTVYLSNASKYVDLPNSLVTSIIDSCYEYSFTSRTWRTLGAINPDLRKSFTNAIDLNLANKKYNAFTRELDFFWVNFSNNTFGKFKDSKSNEIKQEWVVFYPGAEIVKFFQFNMGDTLYLMKLNNENILEHKEISLTESDFELKNTSPIYTNNKFSLASVLVFVGHYGIYILLLLAIGIIIILINKRKKIKNSSIEVKEILYGNFYKSLSVVEKELIKVLYEHNQQGADLNTKSINKIIGVSQKDTLTQNKSRSDHFIKINQKFNLATQQKNPLIIKKRDELDKRQFNYTLSSEYIFEIDLLFKN